MALHKKRRFPLRISSVNMTKFAVSWQCPDLVTFTEEILNEKFHFLCKVDSFWEGMQVRINMSCMFSSLMTEFLII